MRALIIGATALALSACGSIQEMAMPNLQDSKWFVEAINGEPVANPDSYIQMASDGRVGGNTGCNNFFGDYKLDGLNLGFDALGMTKKLCSETLNKQEADFLAAIPNIKSYDFTDGKLQLTDDAGKAVIQAGLRN